MGQLQGPPRIARLQSSQLAVDGVDFRVEALGPVGSVGEEHGAQHPVADLNDGKFRRRARLQTPIEDHRVADRAHDEADPEEREEKEKERKKRRKKDEPEPVYTEFLPMDVYAPGTMDIYDYLTLTFQEPVASIDTAAMHLQQKVDTLWHDVAFDFQQDSTDLKKYNIFADWEWGESYAFSIDSTAIHGLYGLFTDKVKKEFKMKKPEEYGQIFFNVTGTVGSCFVELLDGQDKVLRTVKVVDGKADFYYLNPGKYGARLVEDANDNGVWDTGLYAEKRQPERVYYYPQVLELKANFDLLQDWNVLQLPLDKQKPNELKKQKPDEDKKKNRNRNNNRR